MPTATPTMTLEQKLRAILRQDDTGRGPIGRAATYPSRDVFQATTFELDIRDWGVYYGMAFGIARGEDPFEPQEDVALRALEAANSVFREFGGFNVPRDRDDALKELQAEWMKLSARTIEPLPSGFIDALEAALESRTKREGT